MSAATRLFLDGIRSRIPMLSLLMIQVAVSSFVIGQALFLVADLARAQDRLSGLRPLEGWYQLNDASTPEQFATSSASEDFADRLVPLYRRATTDPDIELLVLPKAATSPGPRGTQLFLVTSNLRRRFGLELVSGTWFPQGHERVDSTPVVVGYDLRDKYRIGQGLGSGAYVCGVLAKDSACYDVGFGMQPIALDGMMLAPLSTVDTDAGTLDGVLNAPLIHFRTATAQRRFAEAARNTGLYRYRFWRLDAFLRFYSADLKRQIGLEAAATLIILGFAGSSFLLGIIRSIASRRREFGVYLAYGAGYGHFWVASALEFLLVVGLGCVVPLALLGPPHWPVIAALAALLAAMSAFIPARILRSRPIPDLMRGVT